MGKSTWRCSFSRLAALRVTFPKKNKWTVFDMVQWRTLTEVDLIHQETWDLKYTLAIVFLLDVPNLVRLPSIVFELWWRLWMRVYQKTGFRLFWFGQRLWYIKVIFAHPYDCPFFSNPPPIRLCSFLPWKIKALKNIVLLKNNDVLMVISW